MDGSHGDSDFSATALCLDSLGPRLNVPALAAPIISNRSTLTNASVTQCFLIRIIPFH